jgi:hypothetical protein
VEKEIWHIQCASRTEIGHSRQQQQLKLQFSSINNCIADKYDNDPLPPCFSLIFLKQRLDSLTTQMHAKELATWINVCDNVMYQKSNMFPNGKKSFASH